MKTIHDFEKAQTLLKRSVRGRIIVSFSDFLKNDKKIGLMAVELNGLNLKHLSSRLQADREIVWKACENNCNSFQYACHELKENSQFILNIIGFDFDKAQFFKHISPILKNDREFLFKLLNKNEFTYRFFSNEFRNDKLLTLNALKINPYLFRFCSKELQKDKDIVNEAANFHGNFAIFNSCHKDDQSLFYKAINKITHDHECRLLQYASPAIKKNKKLILHAVSIHKNFLFFADDSLKQDKDIIQIAFKNKIDPTQSVDDFIKHHVLNNPFDIEYFGQTIRQDKQLILDILTKNSPPQYVFHRFVKLLPDNIKIILDEKNIENSIESLHRVIGLETFHNHLEKSLNFSKINSMSRKI